MKDIILKILLFNILITNALGQESALNEKITIKKWINEFIYDDYERTDRLKNTKDISEVEISVYTNVKGSLNLPDNNIKIVLRFNKNGNLESKEYKSYNTLYRYNYDEKNRLVENTISEINSENKYEVFEKNVFNYYEDKLIQEQFEEDTLISKIEFVRERDTLVKRIYYDKNNKIKRSTTEFLTYKSENVYDYLQGIDTSKENLADALRLGFKCVNGLITSNKYLDYNTVYTYKKRLLIKELHYYQSRLRTIVNYEYNKRNNWIKKTKVHDGKIPLLVIRKIKYRI